MLRKNAYKVISKYSIFRQSATCGLLLTLLCLFFCACIILTQRGPRPFLGLFENTKTRIIHNNNTKRKSYKEVQTHCIELLQQTRPSQQSQSYMKVVSKFRSLLQYSQQFTLSRTAKWFFISKLHLHTPSVCLKICWKFTVIFRKASIFQVFWILLSRNALLILFYVAFWSSLFVQCRWPSVIISVLWFGKTKF